MRKITWQIVALAAVVVSGGVGALVAIAVYAPEYLTATIAAVLAYAAGEGRARLGRPRAAPADGKSGPPYRGER